MARGKLVLLALLAFPGLNGDEVGSAPQETALAYRRRYEFSQPRYLYARRAWYNQYQTFGRREYSAPYGPYYEDNYPHNPDYYPYELDE